MLATIQTGRTSTFDRVVRLKEAADCLGLSVGTVRAHIHAGKIKGVRMSANRLGVRESELERIIKEMEE